MSDSGLGGPEFASLRAWPRSRFARGARAVARDLLGAWLWREQGGVRVGGRIVEVEAYLPAGDPGSHSAAGLTRRNRAMFGPPGHAYVYRIYGLHHCVNVVAGPEGSGQGVLIRALEPRLGRSVLAERRAPAAEAQWTRGPGNLARALGLDLSQDGADLCRADGELRLAFPARPLPDHAVVWGTRIGLGKGQHLALRASLRRNRWVSARRSTR
ncbi:MAG: DNA-3-methyladenine glycosylase [Planctomycetota bacterium]|jgi:DNA-3-methyladenine glycosylase